VARPAEPIELHPRDARSGALPARDVGELCQLTALGLAHEHPAPLDVNCHDLGQPLRMTCGEATGERSLRRTRAGTRLEVERRLGGVQPQHLRALPDSNLLDLGYLARDLVHVPLA